MRLIINCLDHHHVSPTLWYYSFRTALGCPVSNRRSGLLNRSLDPLSHSEEVKAVPKIWCLTVGVHKMMITAVHYKSHPLWPQTLKFYVSRIPSHRKIDYDKNINPTVEQNSTKEKISGYAVKIDEIYDERLRSSSCGPQTVAGLRIRTL